MEGVKLERVIETGAISGRERYQLLTSLVVPRPIAWISSRSAGGVPNLAPFSYFAALSATPMLVGVSIGLRGEEPKDSLANIRATGGFCINVVTEPLLRAMNDSAGEHPPEVDEFRLAHVGMAEATMVDAPYVEECPAVLECRLASELELPGGRNTLVIAEVLAVRLSGPLAAGESLTVPAAELRPVGRLGGDLYSVVEDLRELPRPGLPRTRERPSGAS